MVALFLNSSYKEFELFKAFHYKEISEDVINPQPSQQSQQNKQNCSSQVKQIGENLYNFIDVFKQQYTLNFEGKNTFGSMLGGIIVAIIWVIAISVAGHPFKPSYVTSVDMMDEIVYNYTSQQHPFGINIFLPQGADPIYNNLTVSFGCKQSTFEDSVYLIQNYSVPCQLGEHCIPPGLQCPLYSNSNKDQGSLIISVSACQSIYDPTCDLSFLDINQYVNISISYYSDQISFDQPIFNRMLITRNISIPYFKTGIIMESMQVDYFNSNTYLMGIFGFGTKNLLSLRYGQKFSTASQVKSGYYGVSEGESLFSYILRVHPGSKHLTHNFPSINLWVAEITSFISLVSLFFGFVLQYYETNIFALSFINKLYYCSDKNKKITNLSESSFKTIFAGLLYKPFLFSCYPKLITDYFKNHFNAIQCGQHQLEYNSFMKRFKAISKKEINGIRWNLNDQNNSKQQIKSSKSSKSKKQDQDQDQMQPQKIAKRFKQYLEQQSCLSEQQRPMFLYWIKTNKFKLKAAKEVCDIICKVQKEQIQTIEKYNKLQIYHIVDSWQIFRAKLFTQIQPVGFRQYTLDSINTQQIDNNDSRTFIKQHV